MDPVVSDIEIAKDEARRLALAKIEQGDTADEFVLITSVGTTKVYVAASDSSRVKAAAKPHANPRDCFLFLFEGSLELHFTAAGQKVVVRPGQCISVPAGAEHIALFPEMTVYLAIVDEHGL